MSFTSPALSNSATSLRQSSVALDAGLVDVPALAGADVQPELRVLRVRHVTGHLADGAGVVPEERWGDDRAHGKHVLPAGDHVERDEPSEGRAADGGVLAVRFGAVGPVDERLELLDDEPQVILATLALGLVSRAVGVLGPPVRRVADSDDDERGDLPLLNQFPRRLVQPPFDAAEAGGGVEEVLTVVHVEDGVARSCALAGSS